MPRGAGCCAGCEPDGRAERLAGTGSPKVAGVTESVDLPMPRLGPVIESVDLPMPRLGPVSEHAPAPMRIVLNWGRRYSLWVFNFGLACCAIEFIAASMARHDFMRLGVIPFAPGPRQADLMIVSGTVTDKMAPAVRRLYDQMPEPKYVISFGACANSVARTGIPTASPRASTRYPGRRPVPGCPRDPRRCSKNHQAPGKDRLGTPLQQRPAPVCRPSACDAGGTRCPLLPPPASAES